MKCGVNVPLFIAPPPLSAVAESGGGDELFKAY